MAKILLFGEPMALLIADTVGPLEDVEHFTRSMSGAEVNVAIGLTRLNHEVEYFTRLGDDPFGRYIKKNLENQHIGTSFISFDNIYKTGIQLKNRVTDGSDPYAPYYRKCSAAAQVTKEMVDQLDLSDVDLVHVTGIPLAISACAREATFQLLKRAEKQKIIITFDPNLRPALWENQETMIKVINEAANYADLILPGMSEAHILTGLSDKKKIFEYYHSKGVKTVIIKEGARGACYSNLECEGYVDGYKVEKVVDTIGAGDGFAAGVLSGIVEGLEIAECVKRGNAIGAIQVTNLSDNEGLPTRKELELFINNV